MSSGSMPVCKADACEQQKLRNSDFCMECHRSRRRGFLSIGLGTAVAAVGSVAPRPAEAATISGDAVENANHRDIRWARAQAQAGLRVRLESWRVPIADRPQIESGPSTMTVRQGSPEGVASVEELVLTVGILEGPWELVPEADYPPPPPPPRPLEVGEIITLNSYGAGGSGGDLTLTAGESAGGAVGGRVTITGGRAPRGNL